MKEHPELEGGAHGEEIPPRFPEAKRQLLVLGGEQPTSIGSVIADMFAGLSGSWGVHQEHCHMVDHPVFNSDGEYDIPSLAEYEDCEAMVVTLGRTMVDPLDVGLDQDVMDTIYGCLTLPLLAAKEYITLRHDRGGRVVFIGSYAYNHPITHSEAYCAAKAGLAQATKTLAWNWSEHGYSFHIVHPYHTPGTPMWEMVQEKVMETRQWTREQADSYARQQLKQPEMLTPQEIAKVVLWLVEAPVATWLSGSGIEMYGGTR